VNILFAVLSACVHIILLVPIHHRGDVGDLITWLIGVFCIIGVSSNTSVASLGFTFVTHDLYDCIALASSIVGGKFTQYTALPTHSRALPAT